MGENQPFAINPTFLEIAIPLAERGIPIIPVEPGEKRCLLPDWQYRATTSAEQIARWNAENPNYNVGCVAKPDGIVVLDCDVKGLMRRIEEETGHKFPDTLVVRSAGKGFWRFLRRVRHLGAMGRRVVHHGCVPGSWIQT